MTPTAIPATAKTDVATPRLRLRVRKYRDATKSTHESFMVPLRSRETRRTHGF